MVRPFESVLVQRALNSQAFAVKRVGAPLSSVRSVAEHRYQNRRGRVPVTTGFIWSTFRRDGSCREGEKKRLTITGKDCDR